MNYFTEESKIRIGIYDERSSPRILPEANRQRRYVWLTAVPPGCRILIVIILIYHRVPEKEA